MKNPRVILISGKAQHGKDTFANYLKEELENQGKKVIIDHFAKYIKSYCKQMGWQGEKDNYWRTKLQLLGTEIIKEDLNYTSFHAKRLCEDIKILNEAFDVDYVLVPDTRFRDEIHTVLSYFPNDTISIRILREDFESNLTEEQKNHRSECDLDSYIFDFVLNITTLESSKCKANSFVERILTED